MATALLLVAGSCGPRGLPPAGLGREVPVKPGGEVLFSDLSLTCFFSGAGKNLNELGYRRGQGRFGWNVPCESCVFSGCGGLVESFEPGGFALVRFEGTRVTVAVGMDLNGDEWRFAVDPGESGAVDGGWVNTCTDETVAVVYSVGRAPKARVGRTETDPMRLDARYLQEFEIAAGLKPGVHVLRMEHAWSKEHDPAGSAFNHLYSIRVE